MTNIKLTPTQQQELRLVSEKKYIEDLSKEIESAKTDLERAKLDLIKCTANMDHYIIDYISKLEENIRRLRSVRISAKRRIKLMKQFNYYDK
jgi:hypothetical protein